MCCLHNEKHKSVDIDTIVDIKKIWPKIKINIIIIGDKYPPAIIVELGKSFRKFDKAIHLVDIAKKNAYYQTPNSYTK